MLFNFSQKYFYHIFSFKQDIDQKLFLWALFELCMGVLSHEGGGKVDNYGIYHEQVPGARQSLQKSCCAKINSIKNATSKFLS